MSASIIALYWLGPLPSTFFAFERQFASISSMKRCLLAAILALTLAPACSNTLSISATPLASSMMQCCLLIRIFRFYIQLQLLLTAAYTTSRLACFTAQISAVLPLSSVSSRLPLTSSSLLMSCNAIFYINFFHVITREIV